jgi:hypothetical protein
VPFYFASTTGFPNTITFTSTDPAPGIGGKYVLESAEIETPTEFTEFTRSPWVGGEITIEIGAEMNGFPLRLRALGGGVTTAGLSGPSDGFYVGG